MVHCEASHASIAVRCGEAALWAKRFCLVAMSCWTFFGREAGARLGCLPLPHLMQNIQQGRTAPNQSKSIPVSTKNN